jgi:uncharacterized peroxidase-related enzyme
LAQSQLAAQSPPLPAANFFQLLANSPAATKAYLSWNGALAAGGQLTGRQREILALAVAEINGAKYDLEAHARASRSLGMSEQDICLARKATAPAPNDKALLQFARAVVLQRGDISDLDFEAMRRAGFTDAQITEVISAIALNIFTNYFNHVGRTPLEPPPARVPAGKGRSSSL